ncbi:MAG: ABC transporter ATP-binding protein [Chitinophagales bacterium]
MPVIVGQGLTRVYGDFVAVKGIDFTVERGECFGFLGPNGAGKTSTIRMLSCRLPISGGSLSVLGLDVTKESERVRARIGVVPQDNNLDPQLTVAENLEVYARFFGLSGRAAKARAEGLLEFMQLTAKRRVLVDELSGGMKRRLVIARALINEPELVILDEPTTGLDPHARVLVWERLADLRSRGVTLVLTTHYMDEAWRLCDRLVIMDEGEIIARGDPKAMVREKVGRWVLELRDDDPGLGEWLDGRAPLVRRWERVGATLFIYNEDNEALLRELAAAGWTPTDYLARPASLEDVFLTLTGRTLHEE